MDAIDVRRRNILIFVISVFVLLVATHDGEFWPFSIFPMFSKAGQPWQRIVIRKVEAAPSNDYYALDELPGFPIALDAYGVEAIDVADFVRHTTHWTPQRLQALSHLLQSRPSSQQWLVMRVDGQKTIDGIRIQAVPLLLFNDSSVFEVTP